MIGAIGGVVSGVAGKIGGGGGKKGGGEGGGKKGGGGGPLGLLSKVINSIKGGGCGGC